MLEAIIIGAIILVAAVLLALIIAGAIKGANKNKAEATAAKTEKETVDAEEKAEASKPMKVVVGQGESIVVGSEGRIPCGEYTIESSDGSEDFKVRIGRYVKTYTNGTKVVLTENQKVTPVSTSIVLR